MPEPVLAKSTQSTQGLVILDGRYHRITVSYCDVRGTPRTAISADQM